MGKLTLLSLLLFAYIILTIQPIGLVVAFEKSSNVNEIPVNTDDSAMTYESQQPEDLEQDTILEELPALIVGYANMIRNDIILNGNSVQTKKRGNGKTEIHHGIQDVPCNCEGDGKKLIFLGEDYVPRILETRYCNGKLCPSSYGCIIRSHNVTVLKRKKNVDELSQEDLPEDLKRRWVAVKKHVTVGCTCSKH